MDSQTKLTPDQIAGFEARAAAGERPALEWRDGHIGDAFPMITIHTVDQMPGTNAWTIRPRAEHYVRIATKTAAQLAAEHLLAEATRPLHLSELAEVAGLAEEKGLHDGMKVVGMWQQQVASLEQTLASRDGELAALRDELKKQTLRGDEWKKQYYQAREAGGVNLDTMDSLIARAEAAESTVAELEDRLNQFAPIINEYQKIRDALGISLVGGDSVETINNARTKIAALEAALAEAREDHARTAWAMHRATSLSDMWARVPYLVRLSHDDGDMMIYSDWGLWVRQPSSLTDKGDPFAGRLRIPHDPKTNLPDWKANPKARAIVDAARAGGQG